MRIPFERTAIAVVIVVTLGTIVAAALNPVAANLLPSTTIPVGVIAVALIGLFAIPVVARRLPAGLDGAVRRRPAVAAVWAILALVTVVQTARLSTYMADPTYDWWLTTRQEFWSRHMCMQAYFYGADLNRQGDENIYHADHYPGLNPDADDRSTVANLAPDDPYQYPPQFLVLPRLAIAMSDDFHSIRAVWYGVQALAFFLVAFLFARWLGGRSGTAAMLLIPLVWVSVPSMLNFQYGQFHVTTIALAIGAFLAFESRRRMAGGGLLAASILSKGFPGILLVLLLMQRRWKDALSTGAWMAAFTLVALAVLGPDPFTAFFEYHLPRVRSGAAFAFEEAWPQMTSLLFAGNVSPFSLVRKLELLGVPGMSQALAGVVHTAFSLLLLGVAVLASRVRGRRHRALAWMALINLAAMTSSAAWGDYVPVGTLWMLTAMATWRVTGATALVVGAAWVMCFLVPGVVPIGSFPSEVPSLILSVVCTVLLIGFNGWTALRPQAQREEKMVVALPAEA
jgi:hypothetical protein